MKQTRTLLWLVAALLITVFNFILTPVAQATVTTLSYWRMGENDPGVANGPATSTTDPTGGRTMNLQGSVAYTNNVSATAAAHTGSAWCVYFAGTGYGTNALVTTATDNFGMECWVNPNNTTANECLAVNGSTAGGGWGFYKQGATYYGLLSGVAFVGSGSATSGTWTHLALVRDSGTTTFYVNGVATGSSTAAPVTPTGVFGVAADPQNPANEQFNGCLDEVRVFTFTAGAFSTNDLLLNQPVPIATTLTASGITPTKATLNGTVSPNGLATIAWFQFGITTNYGSFSATNFLVSTNATLPVTNLITGLSLATTYHFQLVASNSAGISVGADQTFNTSVVIPTVVTLPSSGITPTNATLNGTVNPGNGPASFYFQYGLTTNYGSYTLTNNLNATNVALSVSNFLAGLSPGTTYHFQLVAVNGAGTTNGTDRVFNTPVGLPVASTLPAGGFTPSSAVFNGTVLPNGGVTAAYFQYGTTISYGSFSATNILAATNIALTVSNLITGLSQNTPYHFQLIASNSAGISLGGDQFFLRLPATNVITSLADSGPGTLRNAILNSVSGDTITFATNGTIGLTSGELLVTNNLTIIGPGANNLIINGNSGIRLFEFAAGTTSSLSGITLTDGNLSIGTMGQYGGGNGSDGGNGGAVLNAGMLTLTSCNISGNTAGTGGPGGLGSPGGNGGNGGNGGSGGGIYNSGVIYLMSCTLSSNSAGAGAAGGNYGPVAGGFSFGRGGSGGSGGSGGGIYNSGTIYLTNCTFSGNSAGNASGGQRGGDGTGGTAGAGGNGGSGGGIYNSGAATLICCTVANNSAGLFGGSQGMPGNDGSGGGIYGACTLRSTLVAGDTAQEIVGPNSSQPINQDISGAVSSQGHNLIGVVDGSSGLANGVNNDLAGSANAPLNPNLLPLGNYGGAVPTLPPAPGSPAVDAGDNAVVNAPFNLNVDERGFPRKVGLHVDIGACETPYIYGPPQLFSESAGIAGSPNPANGLTPVQLAALVNPNYLLTTVTIYYGLTTAYGGVITNSVEGIGVATNLSGTVPLSGGATYHFNTVAANAYGTNSLPDQTFAVPAVGLVGDLNGDGVVNQADLALLLSSLNGNGTVNQTNLNLVLSNYWFGQSLTLSNVTGLGTRNVTFALSNATAVTFSVQASTNLVNWQYLGPTAPRYLFTDTNAPAAPRRFYRVSFP